MPDPTEGAAVKVEVMLPVRRGRYGGGRKEQNGRISAPSGRPRIPRITRLMALAIKFQDMVDRGVVVDYADLARLGYVTRARITQIMNLLNLAPDLQEQILFADVTQRPHVQSFERQLRPILSVVDWPTQRIRMLEALQDRIRSIQT